MQSEIIAQCFGIMNACYLNVPNRDIPILEMYTTKGAATKASEICHYCTIDVFQAIISKKKLRFSDVRFLNDSTELTEIIPLVKTVMKKGGYTQEFIDFILDKDTIGDGERQTYSRLIQRKYGYEQIAYRTYTCSFSTNNDSLNMWNYYASTGAGINLAFDFSWNIFEGSRKTEVNCVERLENDIVIHRGLIKYKRIDKEKCITKLLNDLKKIFDKASVEYRDYIRMAFKEAINCMSCFFKNEHFTCEEEYRIVLQIPENILRISEGDSNNKMEMGSFKRGNVLIPYIDYPLRIESLTSVTLNPYNGRKKSIFERGIREQLWMNKLENVEVLYSEIPIRKYD